MGCGFSNSQRRSRHKHLESITISEVAFINSRLHLSIRKTLFVIKEVSVSKEMSLVEESRMNIH